MGFLGRLKKRKKKGSITDFFNGFNRISGDSFTGGPTVVADNSGALILPPLNRMGIQGGRLSYNLAEGATLGAELWGGTLATGGAVQGTVNNRTVKTFDTVGAGGIVYTILTVGRVYDAVAVFSGSAGTATLFEFGGSNNLNSGVLTRFTATSTGLYPRMSASGTYTLQSLSVREVLPIWLPADTPAHYVRTRKGTLPKFNSAFKGFLNEPARTNKVTARKHNPTDLTNVTKTGDAATVLSVTQSVSALTAANLLTLCTNGNVYKADGSTAVSSANIIFSGATGNTNPATISIYARKVSGSGTSRLNLENVGGGPVITGAAFTRYTHENKTPALVTDKLQIMVAAGDVVEFILPQLEEGAFVTSVIPGDTLATVTRAATVYSRPTAGVLRANDWGVWGRVVPSAAGQNSATNLHPFACLTDGSNEIAARTSLDISLQYIKRVSGVLSTVAASLIYSTTPYEYMMWQSKQYGMGIKVKIDGGAWSAAVIKNDADGRADAPIAATFQIGSKAGTNPLAGNYPFTAIIQHSDPKAELEKLAARYPTL